MEEEIMETFDLDNVPIFSVGKWEGKGSAPGGDNIDQSFLDKVVSTFEKVGNKIKPRMILAHDGIESKKLSGMPALGWITGLKTESGKLFADFKKVPKKIYDLIKAKAYGRFSPGIFPAIDIDSERYENVLDHVGLLGAKLPADMNLDGFIDLYYENNDNENLVIYNNEVKVMDTTKQDEVKILEFEKTIKNQEDKIKFLEKENQELRESFQAKEYESKKKEIALYLDSQVKEGKIFPAQVPDYMALALDKENSIREFEYIEDNQKKKIQGTGLDFVKKIIDANPKLVEFSEKTEHKEIDKTKKSEDDILDENIKKYMKENQGVTYGQAFDIVTSQKGDE